MANALLDPQQDDSTNSSSNDNSGGIYQTRGNEPSSTTGEPLNNKDKSAPDRNDLYRAEKNPSNNLIAPGSPQDSPAEAQAEGVGGRSWYKRDPAKEKNKTQSPRRWLFTKRRAALGGGVFGAIVAAIFFLYFSGPFQFIHIAQLLDQFHFSAQTDQSDDRMFKIARYIRYRHTGNIEKTRMGLVGNAFADRIETRFNASGIESRYSAVFGFKEGYVVDPQKLAKTDFSRLQGKGPTELKAYFDKSFPGISTSIEDGKLVINSQNVGYFKQRSLSKTMVRAAGYSKLTSSIRARVMGKRDGVTWHPIRKLDNKILATAEARYLQWKKDRVKTINEGAATKVDTQDDAAEDKNATQEAKDGAASAKASADSTIHDGEATSADLATGDSEAVPKYSTKLKFGLHGLAAAGILCVARSLADNADNIKQQQVNLPLIRQAVEMMSIGSQAQSGQDMDSQQLGFYDKQLHGKDSSNTESSWDQGRTFQTYLGNPEAEKLPVDETLKHIGEGSPFDIFKIGGVAGTIMGGFCSTPGQIIVTAISFFTGPIAASVNLAASYALAPAILNPLAHWLAGDAVNVFAVGADFGNNLNYGAQLAANGVAISGGGGPLKAEDASKLVSYENLQAQQDFQNHNVAYKLFNRSDPHSAIAKAIDRTSPGVSQNVNNVAGFFLNFGHSFSSLPKLFSGTARAATPGIYDYGFPTFGFSIDEMNDPQLQNPFANADDVVNNVLPTHPEYLDKASNCFGVSIDPDTYDIASWGDQEPKYTDIAHHGCDDQSEDWRKVRFYIFDTQTLASSECYEGDDHACADLGFSNEAANVASSTEAQAEPPVGGSLPSGTAKELATQLKVYVDGGKILCLSSGCPDIVDTAKGISIKKASCYVDNLDPRVLGMLLKLVQAGHTFILSALCTDHPSNPNSLHHLGKAVDFNTIDSTFMGPNDVPWDQSKINAGKKLDQDIASVMPKSTGFGQIQCHPTFDFLNGFNTFDDACHHQHVQVE